MPSAVAVTQRSLPSDDRITVRRRRDHGPEPVPPRATLVIDGLSGGVP